MKNIFVALAFFAFVGASAQTKKPTAQTAQTAVLVEKLTPELAAERDMKALAAVVTVDAAAVADVNKIFITKYRVKEDSTLSAERLAALKSYVESSMMESLGESTFAKVKTNAKLYNQLVN
jgi:hypothetical protein